MQRRRFWPSTPRGFALAGITFNLFEISMWTLPLWMEVRFLALFFAYGNIFSVLILRLSGAGGPKALEAIPEPEDPFALPAYFRTILESPATRSSLPYSDLKLTVVLLGAVTFFGWLRIRTTAEVPAVPGGAIRETRDFEARIASLLSSPNVHLRFDAAVLDIRSVRLVIRNEIFYGIGALKAFLAGKSLPLFAFEHEVHHGRCWDSLARTVTLFGQRMIGFVVVPLIVSPALLASVAFDLEVPWAALILLLVSGVLAVFVVAMRSRHRARMAANHYREYLADAFAYRVTGLHPIEVRADGNEFHPSRADRLAAIEHGMPEPLSGDALLAILAALSLHQTLGDLASSLAVFFVIIFVLAWPQFRLSYRSLALFMLLSIGETTYRLLLGPERVSLWFGEAVPVISIPELAILLALFVAVWRHRKGGSAA